MEYVQQFLNSEHAEIIMLVVGSVLTVFGFIQVVRKGFALVFWLLLFAAGLIPLVYVFKGSDMDFLVSTRNQVSEIGSRVPGIKDDVLKVWCDKLDAAGQ
jgi:hypothetical protein